MRHYPKRSQAIYVAQALALVAGCVVVAEIVLRIFL
ncbi:hypothetical protein H4V98_002704 [Polaromonas sp. CG_23.6]|nr:hypothetical protein [Polaromonas sp. CG_23.6]